mmetsp:Transcript_6212/g.22869  ORF Transcript_6212/g.22869 Transcript_6212/m.22869 type:complete len:130 (+) Transcript_6212:2302-2691(+)
MYGHAECVKAILEQCHEQQGGPTSLHLLINHAGETPLHSAARWGKYESIQLLVADGADVHGSLWGRQSAQASQAIHLAAQWGHVHALQALLEKGATPDATDQHGRSCSDVARQFHRPAILALLKARSTE